MSLLELAWPIAIVLSVGLVVRAIKEVVLQKDRFIRGMASFNDAICKDLDAVKRQQEAIAGRLAEVEDRAAKVDQRTDPNLNRPALGARR